LTMTSGDASCLVCGSSDLGSPIETKEMFLGLGDRFVYRQCMACSSLRIIPIPESMDRYYPSDYYSLRRTPEEPGSLCKLAYRWETSMGAGRFPLPNPFALIAKQILRNERVVRDMQILGAGRRSRVLDVGCGRGDDLRVLRTLGYTTLVGADPFLDDTVKELGMRLLRSSIHEVDEIFDIITFNHSLEHLPDPSAVIRRTGQLLAEGGSCVIRSPVVPSYAWKRYGSNWVQLDPPRHLFIPSVDGLSSLLKECGMQVFKVVYDSTPFQFWGSELYEKGITLVSVPDHSASGGGGVFNEDEVRAFQQLADKVNASGEGDQAAIYAKKTE
jgi:SAM-dependent methyltransferase